MAGKNVIFALLLFSLTKLSVAQPALTLIRKNWVITTYYEGDYIRFKRKDREHFTAGLIGGLTKDYFRLGEDTTYLYQLEKIDISEKVATGLNAKTIGATFIVAGAVLFLGDLFNETVINKESYSANTGVLSVAGGLVVSGVALQFVKTGNYKLGRRKRVIVMN